MIYSSMVIKTKVKHMNKKRIIRNANVILFYKDYVISRILQVAYNAISFLQCKNILNIFNDLLIHIM